MNFQPLKAFLDYYLPMLGIPGSDTIIYKDHVEVFRHTAGFDNLAKQTPMRRDQIYNIYSCTKVATCVAATQLIERGEIVVSDPVYAYFPEFRNLNVKVKDEAGNVVGIKPAEKTMQIKHLLTMTSGINYNMNTNAIKQVQTMTGGRAPTQDICRAIAAEPLEFEPGYGYQYGLSLDIIGGIIELVTGLKLSEYMEENIFAPLGMQDTGFRFDESKHERFATQYQYDVASHSAVEIPYNQCEFRLGTEFDSGGAGLVSTVSDYILLADALANGGLAKNGTRILSEAGVRLMSSNALNEKQAKAFANDYNSGYGYGFGVRMNLDPAPSGNLAPVGEFGWDGAKLCYLSADPKSHIAVFHAEHMGGLHRVMIPRFRNLVYSCFEY